MKKFDKILTNINLWRNIMNIMKLSISFSIIITIAVLSIFFTLDKMQELTRNTQKMYTHPFKVSNSVADIQTSIVTMHRNMKDIVLTSDSLEIISIIESIQDEENRVYTNFKEVYKYYLGNREDIDILYKSFKAWKTIREEVITLIYQKKLSEAVATTKGKGKKHIDTLYLQIDVLKSYAFNKADEFYNSSINNNSIKNVIYVFLFSMILSGIIVIFIVINLLKINRSNNKQLHLIDQNILTAQIGLDSEIIDVSNALCRSLNLKKTDVINTKRPYFFTNKEQFASFENIIYSAKEYKGEVHIQVEDKHIWFYLEVFPLLDIEFQLTSFNIFLTNISDKKRIEEVSITDTLTGLNNRNYFEIIFDKEIRRAKRDNKELSVVMLDIDYFKQFNDTYGHKDGDNALKSVSHILSAHTNRSYDYAFRVGGEEFVLLSYHEDIESLETFTKTLLKEIESLKIPHEKNIASSYLTSSAGAIRLGVEHLLNTDEIYKEVDSLLYQAKESGRNSFKIRTID